MPPEYQKAMGELGDYACCMNNLYQVNIRVLGTSPLYGNVVHLSIKRTDRGVMRDWCDLQRIKNEVIDPEALAFEVFPDEKNLVDTANQYHLWVFLDAAKVHELFPFFFQSGRLVAEGSYDGAVQRDFPVDAKPSDLISVDEMRARLRHAFKNGIASPFGKQEPPP